MACTFSTAGRHREVQKWPEHAVILTFWLKICFAPQRRALFRHLHFQKSSDAEVFCTLFTSKCASRHNGVHFFHISTSKSGPRMVCFVHFLLPNVLRATTACTFSTAQLPKVVRDPTCFDVFCHFLLQNVLRATTACTFSTSQLPKVVRAWARVLTLFTSKCASRHNGVQFFISHLASYLRTRRFSEPTFRPSGATKHWKNTVFRDFPTFSRTCIFSLLTFSISDLLHLLSSPFWLSPRPSFFLAVPFPSLHIVGSLASKLPSSCQQVEN